MKNMILTPNVTCGQQNLGKNKNKRLFNFECETFFFFFFDCSSLFFHHFIFVVWNINLSLRKQNKKLWFKKRRRKKSEINELGFLFVNEDFEMMMKLTFMHCWCRSPRLRHGVQRLLVAFPGRGDSSWTAGKPGRSNFSSCVLYFSFHFSHMFVNGWYNCAACKYD